MKKIMFNDRFGLTDAVLSGRKTMTRRLVRCPKRFMGEEYIELEFHQRLGQDFWYDCVVVDADGRDVGPLPLPYEMGDVVAVAQRYADIPMEHFMKGIDDPMKRFFQADLVRQAAYRNKMFGVASLMPHHIRITDLWFERLRDISDEDCMKEGIRQSVVEYGGKKIVQWTFFGEKVTTWYDSPRDAFAAMIERICGKGTWESNPWVVAYTFKLED